VAPHRKTFFLASLFWTTLYSVAAVKFCFKTCVAMKFVDDDDDDDDDDTVRHCG